VTLPAPIYSGKVRDLYDSGGGTLIMVASDRISAFDVVLPTLIPDKGKILTALSLWWYGRLADLIPSHLISAEVEEYPAPFRGNASLKGRSMWVRRLDMVMVECVARAYLAGSATAQYRASGAVCGVKLPEGLEEGSRLPEPIFTPTTKGGPTGHDEPMTFEEVVAEVGAGQAQELARITTAILDRGNAVCRHRGILLADTKVEYGVGPDGHLVLADEVLTPDSSRFWPADLWRPGQPQPSFDKQPLRDWLIGSGFNKQSPGPELPEQVVEQTARLYRMAYELITGEVWS
jgi:phosphoribosylaminoimidazole-succinocarboxamide synthase